VAALVVVVALLGAGVWVVVKIDHSVRAALPDPGPPPFTVDELTPAPRSAIPSAPGTVPPAATLSAWVTRVSGKTDIPPRVLRAYAEAERVTRTKTPDCHLTWATVAGIGRIESLNGGHDGSEIDANGLETPPVIGIPLDGSDGVLAVHDTDSGKLDGDPTWDRAIGPMQFLPDTWHRWGVRANGDGKAPDAQNIDDAALTTARYMCAKGGDLATPEGWWTAVLTYNNSTDYGQEVFSNATSYGAANLKP
jgi:membrane-bound lytic murein transglycosylase B